MFKLGLGLRSLTKNYIYISLLGQNGPECVMRVKSLSSSTNALLMRTESDACNDSK